MCDDRVRAVLGLPGGVDNDELHRTWRYRFVAKCFKLLDSWADYYNKDVIYRAHD